MTERGKYLGKYRGIVLNNFDVDGIGRIQVALAGPGNPLIPSNWAMPCLPTAGFQMGMVAIPPIGAGVWIEFEQGDLDYPIWTGCYWGSAAEVPVLSRLSPPPVPTITLQTTGQNGITISDNPAVGIMIKTKTSSIIMNELGIIITNGLANISLTGPIVNINNFGLTVE
jgi:hypothetical protein